MQQALATPNKSPKQNANSRLPGSRDPGKREDETPVSAREHAENMLLERFAQVTSQLITREDPVHLSNEIARAISEVVNFRRVAIIVASQNGALFVAGAQGYSEEQENALRGNERALPGSAKPHGFVSSNKNTRSWLFV